MPLREQEIAAIGAKHDAISKALDALEEMASTHGPGSIPTIKARMAVKDTIREYVDAMTRTTLENLERIIGDSHA